MADEKKNFDDVVENIKDLNNTNDHTSEFGSQDIDEHKLMGILSYILFLFIIPVIVCPNSKYARYHANQGCVLFIVEFLWGVLFNIVAFVLGWLPLVGTLITVIGWVAEAALFVVAIIGIINVINGKAKDLPVIGKVRIIK